MAGMLFRSAGDVIGRIRRERGIDISDLADDSGIDIDTIEDIEAGVPPTEDQLSSIAAALSLSTHDIKFLTGEIPGELQQAIIQNPGKAFQGLLDGLDKEFQIEDSDNSQAEEMPEPVFQSEYGELYNADCTQLLPNLDSEVDCIFADPPFNLQKDYGQQSGDDMAEEQYLQWCTEWIDQCIELLKPGGAFFIYNLPKWNIHLAHYLSNKLFFKHWIGIDIKYSPPRPNQLYPSHYSLLYFIKGRSPNVFDPPRLPIETCPHCGGEQHDYGGYKDKLNPHGISLTDVWDDIPPVRHKKYKNREANELPVKLLHRVISMSTNIGDVVLDPFGGSGTTYATCEIMDRNWKGIELNGCKPIVDRLENLENDRELIERYEKDQNSLFTKESLELRAKYNHIFDFNFEDYQLDESDKPEDFHV